MQFPKLLIYGPAFNTTTGTGITLSNLFRGWPKDRIAVVASGPLLINATTDICNQYYRLGKKESKWYFPFNLILQTYKSGPIANPPIRPITPVSKPVGFRYILVNKIFGPFIRWIGIFHTASKIVLSDELKEWINEYNPEVLYFQVASREGVRFASILCRYLQVPSTTHVMDDWPSIINYNGLLKRYWDRVIDREFKDLLGHLNLHLSISTSMAEEYQKRYGMEFSTFHNPVDLENWFDHSKRDLSIDINDVTVLYAGRIGIGILSSVIEVAKAIDRLNDEGMNISFQIQTTRIDANAANELTKMECVTINPFVEYEELPKIFASADILVLANDFGKQGRTFLKFSMPTKASEYMISGTPILVYAPEESAVLRMFQDEACGHCVYERDSNKIVEGLRMLIENMELRSQLSNNAQVYAKSNFHSVQIRHKFQQALIELSSKK